MSDEETVIRENGRWYLESDGERVPLEVVAIATEILDPDGQTRTIYLQPNYEDAWMEGEPV